MHITKKGILSIFFCLIIIICASLYYRHERALQREAEHAQAEKIQEGIIQMQMTEEVKEAMFTVGETHVLHGITTTLTKIVSDNRCPVDVQCIVKGQVTVEVRFVENEITEVHEINQDGKPFVFKGHIFTLKEVLPKKQSKIELEPKDYTITLGIANAGIEE
jgi:hypothetical protein